MEHLLFRTQDLSQILDEKEIATADAYCEHYKAFLSAAKTERETVFQAIERAEAHGFSSYDPDKALKPGDKIYYNNRGKALILAVIGTEPISSGISIVAAHTDSPRLDIKANPLYENHNLAYFDTHYYGGIKKYQWTAIPLALHGVVVCKDGATHHINIGEDPSDPIFCITDLLPHLADEQMKRNGAAVVKGEELDVLVGSRSLKGATGDELTKLNILKILNEKYGITESDFVSAELEIVPAFPARDIGFDRSLVGAYGQDDRVCTYTALTAILSLHQPLFTAVTILTDKEEVGSIGNTGAQSSFIRDFIEDITVNLGGNIRRVLSNTFCLSADVIATYDPIYPEVTDYRNTAALNRGVVLSKYRGLRGKVETNDTSAEFMAMIRRIFDEENITWQIGTPGKVDAGGGKTIAKFIAANLNVETLDVGVPILSMHAPLEVVSKLDVYMAHKAYSAFFERS